MASFIDGAKRPWNLLHARRVLSPERSGKNPVTPMNEANQLVTAAMTFAFAVMMLASARAFIEQRSAGNISRPVTAASLPV